MVLERVYVDKSGSILVIGTKSPSIGLVGPVPIESASGLASPLSIHEYAKEGHISFLHNRCDEAQGSVAAGHHDCVGAGTDGVVRQLLKVVASFEDDGSNAELVGLVGEVKSVGLAVSTLDLRSAPEVAGDFACQPKDLLSPKPPGDHVSCEKRRKQYEDVAASRFLMSLRVRIHNRNTRQRLRSRDSGLATSQVR